MSRWFFFFRPRPQHNMVLKYKCGAEFLPSPLASKANAALAAEPSLVRKGVMTAVAVAVEMGHAVAFLGTANGEVRRHPPPADDQSSSKRHREADTPSVRLVSKVLKLHLAAHPEVYGRASGEVTGDRVNKDLLLDSQLRHLYITSEKKVLPFRPRGRRTTTPGGGHFEMDATIGPVSSK